MTYFYQGSGQFVGVTSFLVSAMRRPFVVVEALMLLASLAYVCAKVCGKLHPALVPMQFGLDLSTFELFGNGGRSRQVSLGFTCDRGQTMIIQGCGAADCQYDVPDQVSGTIDPATEGTFSAVTTMVNNTVAFRMDAQTQLGFNDSVPFFGFMSASSSLAGAFDTVISQQRTLGASYAALKGWQLALRPSYSSTPPILAEDAVDYVEGVLAAQPLLNLSSIGVYNAFINDFGTHFLTSACFGGVLQSTFATMSSFVSSSAEMEAKCKAEGLFSFFRTLKRGGGFSGDVQAADSAWASATLTAFSWLGGTGFPVDQASFHRWGHSTLFYPHPMPCPAFSSRSMQVLPISSLLEKRWPVVAVALGRAVENRYDRVFLASELLPMWKKMRDLVAQRGARQTPALMGVVTNGLLAAGEALGVQASAMLLSALVDHTSVILLGLRYAELATVVQARRPIQCLGKRADIFPPGLIGSAIALFADSGCVFLDSGDLRCWGQEALYPAPYRPVQIATTQTAFCWLQTGVSLRPRRPPAPTLTLHVLFWCLPGGIISCRGVTPPPPVQGGYLHLAGGLGLFAAVVPFSDGEGVAVWGCERGTSWCGGNFYPAQRVKLVAVGFRHYCVLLATGRVFCHGDDSFHQLGVPSVEGGFAALSSQANCTCGITVLGHKVLCWGDANDAQGGECSAHTLPDRAYRQVLVLNWPYYGICAITDDGDSRILCTESVRRYMSVPGDRLVTQIVYLPNQGFFWF